MHDIFIPSFITSGVHLNALFSSKNCRPFGGLGQSGTQITAELCESGKQVYCSVGQRSHRVPRRVRGLDITWWLHRTGLYNTPYNSLDDHEKKQKRYGPNPSQAPGRDVRMRELCHKHGLVLIGRGENVTEDGVLEVRGGVLHEWMNTIEANVKKTQARIQVLG